MFNYRPIANLSFIFKLTEKIVKKRLLYHLTASSFLNPFQSTKFYSTEITLLSLHDHLSNAIYMQQVSCLCLLDLPLIRSEINSTPSSFYLVWHFLCFTTMVHFISLIPHIYCRNPSAQFPFIPSHRWSSTRLRSRPSSFQSLYHSS